MGFEKAALRIAGVPLAQRIAGAMTAVLAPVVEVGPGYCQVLPVVREDRPGEGPLSATAAGDRALRALGHHGAAVLVACDLPLLDEAVLRLLSDWPGESSVVPVVDGWPQPLCARWSRRDLDAVEGLLAEGERSMRSLLARPGIELLGEEEWSSALSRDALVDVDRPEDLERLWLAWSPPGEEPVGGTT